MSPADMSLVAAEVQAILELGVWAAEGFLHPEIGQKSLETASALVSLSTNAIPVAS